MVGPQQKIGVLVNLLLRKLAVGGGQENVVNFRLRPTSIAPGVHVRMCMDKAKIPEQQGGVNFPFIGAGRHAASLNGTKFVVSINRKSENIKVPAGAKDLIKLAEKPLPNGKTVAPLFVGEMRAN